MSKSYGVVLTGGIATGKSSVASIFNSYGYRIIDADKIAHVMLNKQYKSIALMFGDKVIKGEVVDRKALGFIIFKDKKKRKELEDLLHPLIHKEITTQSQEEDKRKKPYLIDIPLFFETNRYDIDNSLVVYIKPDLQLVRLMQRDNSSKEEALLRIDAQMPIDAKKKKATYIIDNSGTLAELKIKCDYAKIEIEKDFR